MVEGYSYLVRTQDQKEHEIPLTTWREEDLPFHSHALEHFTCLKKLGHRWMEAHLYRRKTDKKFWIEAALRNDDLAQPYGYERVDVGLKSPSGIIRGMRPADLFDQTCAVWTVNRPFLLPNDQMIKDLAILFPRDVKVDQRTLDNWWFQPRYEGEDPYNNTHQTGSPHNAYWDKALFAVMTESTKDDRITFPVMNWVWEQMGTQIYRQPSLYHVGRPYFLQVYSGEDGDAKPLDPFAAERKSLKFREGTVTNRGLEVVDADVIGGRWDMSRWPELFSRKQVAGWRWRGDSQVMSGGLSGEYGLVGWNGHEPEHRRVQKAAIAYLLTGSVFARKILEQHLTSIFSEQIPNEGSFSREWPHSDRTLGWDLWMLLWMAFVTKSPKAIEIARAMIGGVPNGTCDTIYKRERHYLRNRCVYPVILTRSNSTASMTPAGNLQTGCWQAGVVGAACGFAALVVDPTFRQWRNLTKGISDLIDHHWLERESCMQENAHPERHDPMRPGQPLLQGQKYVEGTASWTTACGSMAEMMGFPRPKVYNEWCALRQRPDYSYPSDFVSRMHVTAVKVWGFKERQLGVSFGSPNAGGMPASSRVVGHGFVFVYDYEADDVDERNQSIIKDKTSSSMRYITRGDELVFIQDDGEEAEETVYVWDALNGCYVSRDDDIEQDYRLDLELTDMDPHTGIFQRWEFVSTRLDYDGSPLDIEERGFLRAD